MKIHHSITLDTKCASCGKPFMYYYFDEKEKNGKSELKFRLKSGVDVCENCNNISKGVLPEIHTGKTKKQLSTNYRQTLKRSIFTLIEDSYITTIELERIFHFIKNNEEITQSLAKAYEQLKKPENV